ncbi:MAG TPA: ATP-binding protein, partial [Rhodocyclaceae bacterium]|nr:ATP-binding protein [Rhodocyclaceae bacterium]
AFTYHEARREIDAMLDAHLAQAASILAAQSLHEIHEVESLHTPLLHRYARTQAFQIWTLDGELLLSSENAPKTPLGAGGAGFAEREVEGRHWRVFSTPNVEHRLRIDVAEQRQARDRVRHELLEHLLQPLWLALPLLAVLLAVAIRRALQPLAAIGAELAARAADNLKPLSAESAPAEVRPLLARLNEMFVGIGRSLENERRLTADAAHELRTPLAALKAQAQVALGSKDEAERRHALAQIVLGCDRATHLVAQLLTLARLDAQVVGGQTVTLRALAAEVLAASAGAALEQECELELSEGDAAVRGDATLLSVAIRNLVDNALRHAAARRIRVDIATVGDAVELCVADDGRGVVEAERSRLTRRFYRLASADFSMAEGGAPSGSGLGLSIVQRIAELHRAELSIAPGLDGRGVAAILRFRPE